MTETTETTAVATIDARPEARTLTPEDVHHDVQLVQHVMKDVMQDGTHYGKVPGCGDKPTLLKPGAEKLAMTFRLAPRYEIERIDLDGGHREYLVSCRLEHGPSGTFIGEGLGSCSSMEKKYRYRQTQLACPQCGEAAVIRGKKEYGGGWLCWTKKGGCNAKWPDGAAEIEDQQQGDVENPDIADTFNTVLKMAKKRALVDAVLTATAASDLFTQDIEDMDFGGPVNSPPASATPPQQRPRRNDRAAIWQAMQSRGISPPAAKKLFAQWLSEQKAEDLNNTTPEQRISWIEQIEAGSYDFAAKQVYIEDDKPNQITREQIFAAMKARGLSKHFMGELMKAVMHDLEAESFADVPHEARQQLLDELAAGKYDYNKTEIE